jgi:hypothetical protein
MLRFLRFSPLLWLLLLPAARADVREALSPQDTIAKCVQPDPVSGHSFKPNCKETIVRAGSSSVMSYNAQGFRDKDYPPKPRPGWTRILFVGSSRMVGPGLDEKAVPPRRLESYLRGMTKKLEVINASVEGYSPLYQLTRFKEWLEAYAPTHVVVQIEFGAATNNDILMHPYYNGKTRSFDRRLASWMKPIAKVLGVSDESNYQQFRYAITWESAAYRALHTQFCMIFRRTAASRGSCLGEATFDALEEMAKLAAAAHAKFEIVTNNRSFPNELVISPAFDAAPMRFWDHFTPRVTTSFKAVSTQLEARGVAYQVVPTPESEAMVLPGDYHFSELGADTFARSLTLRLQSFLELSTTH